MVYRVESCWETNLQLHIATRTTRYLVEMICFIQVNFLKEFGGSMPCITKNAYFLVSKVLDCDKVIRLGFLRKVYGILTFQLLVTVAVCAMSMLLTSDQAVGKYQVLSLGSFIVSSQPFYWTIFILTFGILFALMCFKDAYPINYILLTVWTAAISFSVASACVVVLCDPMVEVSGGTVSPASLAPQHGRLYHGVLMCAYGTEQYTLGANTVLLALGITAGVFVGLTIFTLQSKWDFSFLGAGLYACLWLLILWGLGMQLFGGGSRVQYLYRCGWCDVDVGIHACTAGKIDR
jgi:FtsH-binding integral membrane protein